MKKIISLAVAVVMLLSLSIPMTFAADHTVAGTASDVGSVVGLKVDDVAVTSSADYIAKMGYASDAEWTAITTVEQFKNAQDGNFYIAQDLVFAAGDNVIYSGETEIICKKLSGSTTTVIDGCGYSITGINFTNQKAMLYLVNNAETTLKISNLSIGVEGKPVVMNGGSKVGFSVLGNVNGTSIVDNVSIWAELSSTGSGNLAGFHAYAGVNSKIEISNSEMNGSITGSSNNLALAGFVAGARGNVDITNSVNNASVTLTNNTGSGVAGFIATTGNQDSKTVNLTGCVNNGAITHNGSAQIGNGVAGIAAVQRGYVNFVGCVNNGTIKGYSAVGGIGATTYNYHNRKTFDSCTNNGTVTATGGPAHAIYGHTQAQFETSNTMENNNTNTALVYSNGSATGTKIMVNRYENPPMTATVYEDGTVETVYDSGKVVTKYADRTVTDYADGRIETVYNNGGTESVLSTVGGEAKAFLQMTDAYEAEGVAVNDVRFVLVLSEAEYAAISENITFKISFRMTDDTDRSLSFNEIEAFESVTAADDIYRAADGTVICGVIVEGVTQTEWTKCGITYNGTTWTYTK